MELLIAEFTNSAKKLDGMSLNPTPFRLSNNNIPEFYSNHIQESKKNKFSSPSLSFTYNEGFFTGILYRNEDIEIAKHHYFFSSNVIRR